MANILQSIAGSILAPRGFRAAGVFCNIKRLGTGKGSDKGQKRDLTLIVSEVPGTVAGMFTTNQVCAAPVKVCLEHIRRSRGLAQAIVVNSGNANACTGPQGLRDARAMTDLVANVVKPSQSKPSDGNVQAGALFPRQPIRPGHVLVGSTGRIGVTLPMANVTKGIRAAARILSPEPAGADHAAEAIMTSDTRPKQIAVEFKLHGRTARLGGMCKGAGMIQPGMSATGQRPAALPLPLHATMLCFLTSDAAVEKATLQACLREAVAQSFNRITVDGDMSTNDTVLLLANGLAENPVIQGVPAGSRRKAKSGTLAPADARALQTFQTALNHVCLELARMIVRDGEGVTRFVTVRVSGAATVEDADAAARAVANSALVKTSWFGGDPNWGRIIDALGYSAARIVEEKVDIAYSLPGSKTLVYSLKKGQPTATPFKTLCRLVAEKEFDLHIRLNLGRAAAVMYAADLTEDYVEFNKGNVSDPRSLGG